jgi:putative flippase GtrA
MGKKNVLVQEPFHSENMYTLIKRLFQNKLLRFFFTGGVNTVFGYCIFAFLVWIGTPYPAGVVIISTVIGILFNFQTYGRMVFGNRNQKLLWKFILVYFFLMLFNYAALRLLQYLGVNSYISGAVLALPSGLLGFWMHKTFVFPKKTSQPAPPPAATTPPE